MNQSPKLNPFSGLSLIILISFMAMSTPLLAQKVIQPKPKSSPLAMSNFVGKDAYLKVTYGQPLRKGRSIFGNLVPFGQIWRTGANEATEFTTTKDIKINGKLLKAGTYTLFTIPDAEKWTIILNGVLGQWGAYKYDEVKTANVLEFTVPVAKSEDEYEAFTIQFEENKQGADLVILWENTRIVAPIEFVVVSGKKNKKENN
jgi:ABC-type sulfate transport system substrate-binding protein